jgi:hypothetical protein
MCFVRGRSSWAAGIGQGNRSHGSQVEPTGESPAHAWRHCVAVSWPCAATRDRPPSTTTEAPVM